MNIDVLRDEEIDDVNGSVARGVFSIGNRVIYTLEPRPTIIPVGTWGLLLRFSPLRGHAVFEILENDPDHDALEMHAGNWARDTNGCMLTGFARGDFYPPGTKLVVPGVLDSRNAFRFFMATLGVEDAEALTTWSAVRAYTLAHPHVNSHTVSIRNAWQE